MKSKLFCPQKAPKVPSPLGTRSPDTARFANTQDVPKAQNKTQNERSR